MFSAPLRSQPLPVASSDLGAGSSIVLSSADIVDESLRSKWEYEDPPPTELRITLPSWPLGKSVANHNARIKVYLRRYFFDCVWRDAADPTHVITSNSGTSLSKKIMLTFYVGPQGTTRLLRPNIAQTTTGNPDIIITRNQGCIGELASNPYSTIESSNIDLFFENQYTNMNEYIGQPGLYIGDVDTQALAALKSNTVVTVKVATDRDDFPSPFWYKKFLTGVSLWNPLNHAYDVVPADTEVKKYFKRLQRVTVSQPGGPYFPTCLFKLKSPLRFQLHPQIVKATITDVSDPVWGEFVTTNNKLVSCFISQIGLASSVDAADIRRQARAYSDEREYAIPIFDPAESNPALAMKTFTVANDQGVRHIPPRFSAGQSFQFPNGVWRGVPLSAQPLAVDGNYSCFPFEQSLSTSQQSLLNDSVVFNQLPPSVKSEIVPCHQFLFMDPGSAWLEDTLPTSGVPCTVGERALQFDLGRPCFINKVQIVFPRSQEDYQPVRFGASLQRKYSGEATLYTDAAQATWFGNYQHDSPKGWRDSTDATADYAYLNTHTQTSNNLYGGSTQLMELRPNSTPSTHPYSGGAWRPDYAAEDRAGRYHVVMPNSGDDTFVSQDPSVINPGFDFYRQEYGPFVRGCTLDELYDTSLVKAVTLKGYSAEWVTKQQPFGHHFLTPEDFFLTEIAQGLFKVAVFVVNPTSHALERLADDTAGRAALQDVNTWKYLYPVNFTDSSQNPFLKIAEFTNFGDFLLNTYSVYLVSGDQVTDYPLPEYIVKESYYFAPHYNQYSVNDLTSSGEFRPPHTDLAQKMIRQEFGQGRYFGFTCGSFLGDTPGSRRYTRGTSNKVRLYSIRLCTQLFSFTTNLGTVVDTSSNPTSIATFRKRYEGGILTACYAEKPGVKYAEDSYEGSDHIKMYPTVPGHLETVFIDPSTGVALDRTDTLMTNNSEALNHAAAKLQLTDFDDTQPALVNAVMEDDTALGEYKFYLKAASKTPLRRFMEIQLDLMDS